MSSEQFSVNIDSDLKDLIPEYLGSIRSNMERILQDLEENDFEHLFSLGHNMKGSGGGYGFNKISEIGLVIENGAKENDKSAILKSIDSLKDYLDNLLIEYVEVD